jgi:hypothetical protein
MSLGLFEVAANLLLRPMAGSLCRGGDPCLPDDTLSYGLKPNVDMPAANNYVYPGVTVRINALAWRDDPPDSWRTNGLWSSAIRTPWVWRQSRTNFVKRLEAVLGTNGRKSR